MLKKLTWKDFDGNAVYYGSTERFLQLNIRAISG